MSDDNKYYAKGTNLSEKNKVEVIETNYSG